MSIKKDKILMVRMTQAEYNRLRCFAEHKDTSMAEILRTYVKKLPKVEIDKTC